MKFWMLLCSLYEAHKFNVKCAPTHSIFKKIPTPFERLAYVEMEIFFLIIMLFRYSRLKCLLFVN